MIVQLYNDDNCARLFDASDWMVCELHAHPRHGTDPKAHVEERLRRLRLRRATKWTRTAWGWQARLRFINPPPARGTENG